jgi:hypothetical protein
MPAVRRRPLLALALALSAIGAITVAPSAEATAGAYLTISFGRTQWVAAERCKALTDAVPLDVVAQAMAVRGMTGTGNVITDRTRETGFLCVGYYMLELGWDRLAMLRDSYGWSFVSASKTYRDIRTVSSNELQAETCGTVDTFEAHGHTRAWGMYAYARNRFTTDLQTNLVSTCFAYGRRYGSGVNHRASSVAPWFNNTNDVTGGRCALAGQPCSSLPDVTGTYNSPRAFSSLVKVAPDDWVSLQFYRFVTGSRGTPSGIGQRWDCTSTDWRAHWTSRAELYCYNDFLRILDAVPAGVTVTDPAGVATAWGRVPPFS